MPFVAPPVVIIVQGVLNFILPLISCMLEFLALKKVDNQHDSICTQAREISPHARVFQLLVSIVVLPDIVFALSVIGDLNSAARPLCVLYHALALIVCTIAASQLKAGISYCGNPSQDNFDTAAGLVQFAAIIHFIFIPIILWQMQDWIKKTLRITKYTNGFLLQHYQA